MKLFKVIEKGEEWFVNLDLVAYAKVADNRVSVHFKDGLMIWFNMEDGKRLLERMRRLSKIAK